MGAGIAVGIAVGAGVGVGVGNGVAVGVEVGSSVGRGVGLGSGVGAGLGGVVGASMEAGVAPLAGVEGVRRAGVAVGKDVGSAAGVACSVRPWVTAVVSVGAGKSPAGSPCSPLQAARERRTVHRIAASNTFVVAPPSLPAILPSNLIPSSSNHLGKDSVLSPQNCQQSLSIGVSLDPRDVGCSGSRYPALSGVADNSWRLWRGRISRFTSRNRNGGSLAPALLVISGHCAPVCRLALGVVRRHLGALPPAGRHQRRKLNPALDQVLGHANAATRFETPAFQRGVAGNSPVSSHGCKCPPSVAEGVAGKPGLFLPGRKLYFRYSSQGGEHDDAVRLRPGLGAGARGQEP